MPNPLGINQYTKRGVGHGKNLTPAEAKAVRAKTRRIRSQEEARRAAGDPKALARKKAHDRMQTPEYQKKVDRAQYTRNNPEAKARHAKSQGVINRSVARERAITREFTEAWGPKKSEGRRTTITNANGTRFSAVVFENPKAAQAYAIANPVLIRNAAGSLLRHSAPIHKVKGGRFAITT